MKKSGAQLQSTPANRRKLTLIYTQSLTVGDTLFMFLKRLKCVLFVLCKVYFNTQSFVVQMKPG